MLNKGSLKTSVGVVQVLVILVLASSHTDIASLQNLDEVMLLLGFEEERKYLIPPNFSKYMSAILEVLYKEIVSLAIFSIHLSRKTLCWSFERNMPNPPSLTLRHKTDLLIFSLALESENFFCQMNLNKRVSIWSSPFLAMIKTAKC